MDPASSDKLVLYNWATSTCSQKVRFVLAEKNILFEDRRLDARQSEHLADWYLELNPNGVVPTLTHGGRAITESSVITEYLDEVFPENPLSPAEPFARAKMRSWRHYIDEVPTAAIRVPSYNGYIAYLWRDLPQEQFDALTAKRTIRRQFYRKMGRDGSSAEEEQNSIDMLRQTVERMDRSLVGSDWVAGERLTLADIALIPTLVRMSDIGLGHLWDNLPRVAEWYARMEARPAFGQTFYPGSRYGPRGSHPAALDA